MYAKLTNGAIRSAPKRVQYNDKQIFNPPDIVLQELGYLPVTYTDMPSDAPDGQHYESSWTQIDTEILQVWKLADDPAEPDEISVEEALAIITGGST